MSKIKKTKKLALLYIAILMFSFICRVESKFFQAKVKKNLGTRKAYLQQDIESLKDAFTGFFKIGTSVSPHEFSVGSDFIKKHFNSITPENELKPDSILNQQAYVDIHLFGIVKLQIGSLEKISIQEEIMFHQILWINV